MQFGIVAAGDPPRPSSVNAGATFTDAPTAGGAAAGMAFCPIHGQMDPTWSRCPHCLKEGREGRLLTPSSGVPRRETANVAQSAAPPTMPPPMAVAPPEPPAPMPPPAPVRRQPPPMVAPVAQHVPPMIAPAQAAPPQYAQAGAPAPPAAYPQAEPPAPPRIESYQPSPPPALPGAPHFGVDRPISSVGQTFAIRRRPRMLSYLIEKEGEQVGRVFQLEEDVTDIGRDPRNHIAVNDVMVSGFHARVERAPDGSIIVIDRGSTNGSRLNGEPLTEPRVLDENDEISVGNTTLVLKVVS